MCKVCQHRIDKCQNNRKERNKAFFFSSCIMSSEYFKIIAVFPSEDGNDKV